MGGFLGASVGPAAAQDLTGGKWTPWFEIGGYGASDDRSRGEAALWAPLTQSANSVLFADVRGRFFVEDVQEGNLALGYRQMFSGGWNLGAWVGYDVRHTEYGSNFDQVSFGVEALHPFWDVRLNGYVPLEDEDLVSSQSSISATGQTLAPTAQLIGGNIFLQSGGFTTTTTTTSDLYELGFWGLDGEIGLKVPLDLGEKTELRAYAGGFYFEHDDFDDTIAGPRGRLEYRINEVVPGWSGSRLTLEAEAQWDDVRGDIYEGGARLRLPFGGGTQYASLTAQEKRMMEGLERDTDIVTQTQTTSTSSSVTTGSALVQEEVEDAITDVHFERAVVTGGAATAAAVTTAGSNSLIIVNGSLGNVTTGVFMSPSQTLQGGGSTIQVRGIDTGLVAGFTAPGTTPTFSAPLIAGSPSAVIVASDKTHLAGVNIEVAGGGLANPQSGVAIAGNLTQVVVEQTSFAGSPGINVGIGLAAGATVADLQVFDVTAQDLFAFAAVAGGPFFPVSNMTAKDIELTDVLFGFQLAGFDSLTIEDVEHNGGLSIGYISAINDLEITNYTANLYSQSGPNPETGLSLRNAVHTATITNVSIDGAGSTATAVSLVSQGIGTGVGTVGGILFDGLHVSNFTGVNASDPLDPDIGSGIVETSTGGGGIGNVTVRNSSFENVAGSALLMQNGLPGRNVIVENNTFDNVANVAAGTYVLRDFAGANISGSGNVMTNVGAPCQAGPASGSIAYTDDGNPGTCP